MNKTQAIHILLHVGARVDQEFHSLRSEQVLRLLHFADECHYRRPANSNGSRGRAFYAYVSRKARAF